MFEKDFIMRQISLMVQVAAQMMFGKRQPVYIEEDAQTPTDGDLLHAKIMRLLAEKKYNEAEDALFDNIDAGIPRITEIATEFYYQLSLFHDDELEAAGFSRAEIDQGLSDFMSRCGISLPISVEMTKQTLE